MKFAIIINGLGLSGKDTVVEMFSKYVKPIRVYNYSSINSVKEASLKLGWNGKDKTDRERKFWSELKKAWVEYNQGPLGEVVQIATDKQYKDHMMFIHCREPKEIDKIKETLSNIITVKTLLIKRDVEVSNNDSDRAVYNYEYDFIIDNDGSLEDLDSEVMFFVNYLFKNGLKYKGDTVD